jgi:hypothetical protein
MIRLLALFALTCSGAALSIETQQLERPTSGEMTALFKEDQQARQVEKVDWAKREPEDAVRRKRTRDLLDAGGLKSGNDYFHAAFIFQHGPTAEDHLLAHVLAMAAIKLGREDASWIATATLDRYLQRIGQSQVLGTQYQCENDRASMEPYERRLVPDSVREILGVPVGKAQEDLGNLLCGRPSN